MAYISTDMPSFLKLADGDQFSLELLYQEQTIRNAFMSQDASTASTSNGTMPPGASMQVTGGSVQGEQPPSCHVM